MKKVLISTMAAIALILTTAVGVVTSTSPAQAASGERDPWGALHGTK